MKDSKNNYLRECLNKNSDINKLMELKKEICLNEPISYVEIFNSGNIICSTLDGFFSLFNTNFDRILYQKIEKKDEKINSIDIYSQSILYFVF